MPEACAHPIAVGKRRRVWGEPVLFALAAIAAGGLLGGCEQNFAVRCVDPLRYRGETPGRVALGPAGAWTAEGVRAQRAGQNEMAVCLYLRALEALAAGGGEAPGAEEARRFATARVVELCAPALFADPRRPLEITAPARAYRVSVRRGPGRGGVAPGWFLDLLPTDRLEVSRSPGYARTAGVGAPLVGDLRPLLPMHVGRAPAQPTSGLTWAVTARVSFGPPAPAGRARGATLDLYAPQQVGPAVGGRGLAADYTAPLAVSSTRQAGRRRWLGGFFNASTYFDSSGLYPTEPPTPNKTPLVLVHGLLSDPGYFRHLRNALAADPVVRQRYQVWVFYYPTTLPTPYSAMLLREDLRAFIARLDPAGAHPALHRAVLVGHSMGGILCRLAVSNGGERFYRHFLRRPLDELRLGPAERDLARRGFFSRGSPDVRAVVFVATPHRGSNLVLSPLGVLGRFFGRLPRQVSAELRGITKNNPLALADPSRRVEGSVYLLGPRSPMVAALAEMPLPARRVRFYSIIGDRGRGGTRAGSSDGVVPYASSHQSAVRRETIVSAGHSSILTSPTTAAEVVRIAREEAGSANAVAARTRTPGRRSAAGSPAARDAALAVRSAAAAPREGNRRLAAPALAGDRLGRDAFP